ncbi:phosphotransferase enzyme family protein [Rhizoctonia solani]|uniref:Phosphotransferase enzyme family protein n=1 Tax=Rhizoctonia solani TaxID=456999 RepID=A0A8H8T281_9AGAM|nr:phosphotransferase enzyme family protein [Rhizoctonia solani]QRW25273.1 phosphotransferase enzyme family protein [Rhizoctonia solani]
MSGGKIGGEYGEIRANIDIQSLNKYLGQHGRGIRVPVEVKQFKVRLYNIDLKLYDAEISESMDSTFVPISYIPGPLQLALGSQITSCLIITCPFGVGLENFGPHTPYFPRQIKSLSKLKPRLSTWKLRSQWDRAQAKVVDVETKEPVGPVPDYDEMIAWYREHLPDESKTGLRVVHGDYKIDNIVFHPTEPRVIGILDWELCTLGSPLADLANLLMPYHVDPAEVPPPNAISGFKGQPPDAVPCSLEELERAFCDGFGIPYPITEMVFANSWMIFRLSIISQGVAARYARRQASSANAKAQGDRFPMLGGMAKRLMLEGSSTQLKAKL